MPPIVSAIKSEIPSTESLTSPPYSYKLQSANSRHSNSFDAPAKLASTLKPITLIQPPNTQRIHDYSLSSNVNSHQLASISPTNASVNTLATAVASKTNSTKTTNTVYSMNEIATGCSRTIPIAWNSSYESISSVQVCIWSRCLNHAALIVTSIFLSKFGIFLFYVNTDQT